MYENAGCRLMPLSTEGSRYRSTDGRRYLTGRHAPTCGGDTRPDARHRGSLCRCVTLSEKHSEERRDVRGAAVPAARGCRTEA